MTTSAGCIWDGVASAWDRHVDYVDDHSAAPTATMIERLDVRAGERVLELAAGPGTLGRMFAELVGATGSVVVSDLSPAMVEVACHRNADEANVTCEVIDLSDIARPDASFDVVACRMGLMFAPEPDSALREIRRVLTPETGRLGALTWGAMATNPWMTCVGMAAMLAGVATDGPPVGPGSIFSLGEPTTVETLLDAAGFEDIRVEPADVVFRAPDIDTHVTRVGSLAGPLAARIDAATPAQHAALRDRAGELAAPYASDHGFEIPGRVLVITARA